MFVAGDSGNDIEMLRDRPRRSLSPTIPMASPPTRRWRIPTSPAPRMPRHHRGGCISAGRCLCLVNPRDRRRHAGQRAHLVRGRADRLRHLMHGLAARACPPRELVIAWMQPERAPRPARSRCPVRHCHVPGERCRSPPRATAPLRRRPAIFWCFSTWTASPRRPRGGLHGSGATERGLFLGEVLYLPPGATDTADLDRLGRVHPARPPLPVAGLRREPDAGQLWGLSFALPAEAWRAVAAWTRVSSATAERRQTSPPRSRNPACRPSGSRARGPTTSTTPVHDAAAPALLGDPGQRGPLHARHGRWCMTTWLEQFSRAGLIAWNETARRSASCANPRPARDRRGAAAPSSFFLKEPVLLTTARP